MKKDNKNFNNDDNSNNDIEKDNETERRKLIFKDSSHCAAYCFQHIRSSDQGAVTCNMRDVQNCLALLVLRHTSAVKSYRFEIALILTLFRWLNPLTHRGGQKTGRPGENPQWRAFRKLHILKLENSSPNRSPDSHSSIGAILLPGKQTCLPLDHATPDVSRGSFAELYGKRTNKINYSWLRYVWEDSALLSDCRA